MGAQPSKTNPPPKPTRRKLIKPFGSCDGVVGQVILLTTDIINGLGIIFAEFKKEHKVLKECGFTEKELAEFHALERRKGDSCFRIEEVIRHSRTHYRTAIENIKSNPSAASLVSILDPSKPLLEHLEGLITTVRDLQADYREFLDKINLTKDSANFTKYAMLIIGCLSTLLLIGIGIYYNPDMMRKVLDAGEQFIKEVFGSRGVRGILATVLKGVLKGARTILSEYEYRRAIAFLENVPGKLEELETALKDLRDDHACASSIMDPDRLIASLEGLIKQCDKLKLSILYDFCCSALRCNQRIMTYFERTPYENSGIAVVKGLDDEIELLIY